ncbi:M48 family metalloprotease, partial [Aquifex sp.]
MRLRALFLFFILFFLACTQVYDPLTGKKVFTVLPPEEEIAIGKKLVPQAITEFEGQYPDKEVREYVKKIGLSIAQKAPRKLPYEFFITNSSVVNAFALPGGKIVITRGIFLLFDEEC